MTRDYYEFMLTLRGSGLIHNTPEFLARLTALSYFCWDEVDSIRADNSGNLYLREENGEIGAMSENARKNMRNCIISTCSILPIIGSAENVDYEQALTLTDYYISLADTVQTYHHFNQIMQDIFTDFQKLVEQTRRPSYGTVINRCIEYIDQHMYGKLTVREIAAVMGYSCSYLSALFKEKTGFSLQQYLLYRRADETKKLLAYTDRPMTEIAGALGFSSEQHMSAFFRHQTGITPSEYRRQGTPRFNSPHPEEK